MKWHNGIGDVGVGSNYQLRVIDESSLNSAFGEKLVASLTPKEQIQFPYNVNTRTVNTTVAGSGAVTQANGMLSVSSGAATSSGARMTSKRVLKYNPGQGGMVRFTAMFTTPKAGSTQWAGIGDANDGFFFGYNGTTFGVMRRRSAVDNFTPQSDWNVDKADGSGHLPVTDFTKLNVFQIQYQWLGAGAIRFSIEDSSDYEYNLVHTIAYAGNNTQTSILNPSLPLCIESINTTNNTAMVIKSASMGAFIEGEEDGLGLLTSKDNSKSSVGTTLTNILTIRNDTTFAGTTNRTPVKILSFTVAVEASKPCIFKVIENTTLGGSPSYTNIDANTSLISFDTAGTTCTGGTVIFSSGTGKAESARFFLADIDYEIHPGDTLTLAVAATATTADVVCSVNVLEKF